MDGEEDPASLVEKFESCLACGEKGMKNAMWAMGQVSFARNIGKAGKAIAGEISQVKVKEAEKYKEETEKLNREMENVKTQWAEEKLATKAELKKALEE